MTTSETQSRAALRRLSALMRQRRQRRDGGDAPFVVFLGAGASLSAGYPNIEDFMKRFLRAVELPNVNAIAPGKDLEDAFGHEWRGVGATDKYRIVREVFPPVEPSRGYYRLAELVRADYVRLILTTNIDPLAEYSLAQAGMPLRPQNILIVGVHEREQISFMVDTLLKRAEPFVLKLHGDALWGEFAFTRERIDTYLGQPLESKVTSLFQSGLVMVGSSIEDSDVRRCLIPPRGTFRESMFFVNPAGETQFLRENADSFSSLSVIRDENGDPLGHFDHFFTELHSQLFPQPSGVVRSLMGMGAPLYQDAFTDNDLAGVQVLLGSYGIQNSLFWLGSTDQNVYNTATAVIPHILERNLMIESTVQIEDDGGDPSNWVGFSLRGTRPVPPDGVFVRFHSNMSVDLIGRSGSVLDTKEAPVSLKERPVKVSIDIQGTHVKVQAEGKVVLEYKGDELSDRLGRVYIHSYRSRSKLSSLRLLP